MPFMAPWLRMCLFVGLLAGGSGIIQLGLSKYPGSFSGKNVLLLLFEKVPIIKCLLQHSTSLTVRFLTSLRVSIL